MTFFCEKVGSDKIEGVCAMTLKIFPSIRKSPCLQKFIKYIYIFSSICHKFIPRCQFSDSEQYIHLPLRF